MTRLTQARHRPRTTGGLGAAPGRPSGGGAMATARVVAKLERGGAQLSLLRVAQALAGRGIRTSLLAGSADDEGIALARRHGLEPEVFGGARDLQWTPHEGFAAWLAPRLRGADLVHAHMFGGWWAAARAAAPGQPVIASEHNSFAWPDQDHTPALEEALPRVALLFAHGPGARRTVLDAGLAAHRLRDGVSPVAGMGATPQVPGARTVLYAGRFAPDKGPDVFLDAVALLRGRPPVVMLGAGRMVAALRAQRARLGLEERVLMPGWAFDPAPAMARAAVLVIPSRDESFSQTAVLGMALGVPVIGTDVDGFPETLGQGRGIVVAPDDPPALAAAIDGVLDGRLRVDTEGARRFARRFTNDRVAGIYEQAYRAAVLGAAEVAPA